MRGMISKTLQSQLPKVLFASLCFLVVVAQTSSQNIVEPGQAQTVRIVMHLMLQPHAPVLFASGKCDLQPEARERLAKLLGDRHRSQGLKSCGRGSHR